MKKMNSLDWIAFILLIIGGLNWGLVGFFGIDLVAAIFGPLSAISRLVYVLVGFSALYMAIRPAIFEREECLPVSETIKSSKI